MDITIQHPKYGPELEAKVKDIHARWKDVPLGVLSLNSAGTILNDETGAPEIYCCGVSGPEGSQFITQWSGPAQVDTKLWAAFSQARLDIETMRDAHQVTLKALIEQTVLLTVLAGALGGAMGGDGDAVVKMFGEMVEQILEPNRAVFDEMMDAARAGAPKEETDAIAKRWAEGIGAKAMELSAS